MNCREFQDWLSDIECSHETRVGWAHVEQCGDARCRSLWEEFLVVEDAIAAWKGSIPQVNLMDRVWSAVETAPPMASTIASRRESPKRRQQSSSRAWIALSMSAAIVALSLWGLSVLNRPDGNAGPNVVAETPTEDPPRAEPPLQKYSVASVSLAQSASAFVADAALLTVHDIGDPDDPSRPVSAWATKVSRQFQPLSEDLNNAWEFIDKVIPDMSVMEMMPTS